jgi:hypothetical protein
MPPKRLHWINLLSRLALAAVMAGIVAPMGGDIAQSLGEASPGTDPAALVRWGTASAFCGVMLLVLGVAVVPAELLRLDRAWLGKADTPEGRAFASKALLASIALLAWCLLACCFLLGAQIRRGGAEVDSSAVALASPACARAAAPTH